MSKYSFELKMTIIHEYLKGKGGYPYLAKKYGIKSMGQVRYWVKSYQEFGKEGVTFLFKWQKFPAINDKSYQLWIAFYMPITKLSLAASTTSTVILSI